MIELVAHTGELEMRLTHPTLEGLYGEALRGLAREVSDAVNAPREGRAVAIASSGTDTLLADLLNEAVYLMDAECFVADGLEDVVLRGATLTGTLVGRRDPALRPVVKAVTYHGLGVRPVDGGWEGTVVLDV